MDCDYINEKYGRRSNQNDYELTTKKLNAKRRFNIFVVARMGKSKKKGGKR